MKTAYAILSHADQMTKINIHMYLVTYVCIPAPPWC